MPAFRIAQSTGPSVSMALVTALATASGSITSQEMPRKACRPLPISSSLSARRATALTVWPSERQRLVSAAPMPELAPVMK